MNVLITHAYSAKNAGDGLLVDQAVKLVREVFGESVRIVLLAHDPDSFQYLDSVTVLQSKPTLRGYPRALRSVLGGLAQFDLVVGVGGGYLRWDSMFGGLKAALVHGPQLAAVARAARPSIYLPQSIGPAPWPIRPLLSSALSRLNHVLVRDGRSLEQFRSPSLARSSDLALHDVPGGRQGGVAVSRVPVLSIRAVRGRVEPSLLELAERFQEYDAYIQSEVGANDDRPATALLSPQTVLSRSDFLGESVQKRVVVAVRLHAALMALAAGHYVIHIAYERKGFGAFEDLRLSEYVHNLRSWNVDDVVLQVNSLVSSADRRSEYDAAILSSSGDLGLQRDEIVGLLMRLGNVA